MVSLMYNHINTRSCSEPSGKFVTLISHIDLSLIAIPSLFFLLTEVTFSLESPLHRLLSMLRLEEGPGVLCRRPESARQHLNLLNLLAEVMILHLTLLGRCHFLCNLQSKALFYAVEESVDGQ